MEKLSYLCTLNTKVENCYVISLASLQHGSVSEQWKADGKFFEEFGSNDIRYADVTVDAVAVKAASAVKVDIRISGSVTVSCDRCLEDLTLNVDTAASLIAGTFDSNPDEREEIGITDGLLVLDQVVYDYVITSLPLVKVHAEGECAGSVTAYLGQKPVAATGSPFEGLKDLLK